MTTDLTPDQLREHAAPVNLMETGADTVRRYAGELMRLIDGLAARGITPAPDSPVDTAPVDTALAAVDSLTSTVRMLEGAAPAGESQASEPAEYLIWSHHHKAWFAPNGCGYRSDITDAGRYALDATKRWLGRGCGCCLVPEVVIPAPGPKVLARPGLASHWASTHIEAATNARIGGGDVNSCASGNEHQAAIVGERPIDLDDLAPRPGDHRG